MSNCILVDMFYFLCVMNHWWYMDWNTLPSIGFLFMVSQPGFFCQNLPNLQEFSQEIEQTGRLALIAWLGLAWFGWLGKRLNKKTLMIYHTHCCYFSILFQFIIQLILFQIIGYIRLLHWYIKSNHVFLLIAGAKYNQY